MEKIDTQVIKSAEALTQFAPEWRDFLKRVPPPTPFQTPEWLLTWWAHLGSATPHTVVFRHRGEVAGILPCFLHDWKGRQQLTLMGSGISDYLDPVFDECHVEGIIDALRSHLEGWRDWEICDWQDLSADTPVGELAPLVADTPCSRVALVATYEEFLAERPKDLRRNLRRYKEKAEGDGPVRFSWTSKADRELLTALMDLHGARWRNQGEPGMIEVNGSAAFLMDVAPVLACCDMLRVFTVWFKDKPAAILMALRNQTTIFSYLSGFDPTWDNFGFGRELLAQALHYAYTNSYKYWDFLRGDEHYKSSWGAQIIPKSRMILDCRDLAGGSQTYRPVPHLPAMCGTYR